MNTVSQRLENKVNAISISFGEMVRIGSSYQIEPVDVDKIEAFLKVKLNETIAALRVSGKDNFSLGGK